MDDLLNIHTVHEHWGEAPPEWVVALADACDESSQGAVAKRIGMSAAVVNQALRNAYKGRLDRVADRVKGELLREVVDCPVLGEISTRRCLDEQVKKLGDCTNFMARELWRACRGCTHRRST